MSRPTSSIAEDLAGLAQLHGLRIATAESLTAGNIAATLGRASDAGEWYLGGIVAYDRSVKYSLLRVPEGPVVCEASAIAMADTTADLLGADLVLSATGEAGPDTQEDVPAGTVWFGVHGRDGHTRAIRRHFAGGPQEVIDATVGQALMLLVEHAATTRTA